MASYQATHISKASKTPKSYSKSHKKKFTEDVDLDSETDANSNLDEFHPSSSQVSTSVSFGKSNFKSNPSSSSTITATNTMGFISSTSPPVENIAGSNPSSSNGHSRYDPLHPIIPGYVLKKVLTWISKVKIHEKKKWVMETAKYWALKRETRKGAPLLKRLHLEPWTASASVQKEDEIGKAVRWEVN